MEAYKISTKISKVGTIQLPERMKPIFNHEVELVVLDLERDQEIHKDDKKARGILKHYAKSELIDLEKEAFQNAVKDKHEKKTRDLLLPRLMSGKMEVANMDISPLNPPKGDL